MLKELVPYGTTVQEVLKHRGKAEDWELLSNISAILMYKEEKDGLQSLTKTERFISAIHGMTMEVNNGGFHQFFFNSTGVFTYDLVPALKAINSIEFKKIAVKALEIFGKIPSLDESTRYKHLDQLTHEDEIDPWEVCDGEYYECGEQIEQFTIDYLLQNLDDICS
ncbi:DMP19 family protein [Lutimonas sp.]|uniref:DMP19 family protein n=1 Tax=Lutimonas sp. TaxID=1872403 RepID=UPI003D9BCEB2